MPTDTHHGTGARPAGQARVHAEDAPPYREASTRTRPYPAGTRGRGHDLSRQGGSLPKDAEPLVSAMDTAGYRLTEPRRAVAQLIAAREGHFTAADLLDDVKARRLGIGRATIFRCLDLLTELNVLERLDLPSGEHAYVPCEPVHHHHVVCSNCGRVTEVDDRGLASAVEDIERRTGWQVESHRLELYGRCPRCRIRRPS